jgi:SLOG cluster2/TIR domain
MGLFLSHAKLDGESAAKALRDYIHENLALETFFDAIDIAVGFRFADEIDAGIDTAAFAIVHTDAYASRVWCQYEVIGAKRRGRPVVVIHAIEEGEARSFPYIGNVPTIRWRPNDPVRLEAIVGLVLREVLRTEYFGQHFGDLRVLFKVPDGVRALPRAPELLTALALRHEADQVPFFAYPDPPLAKQELDLVLELAPNLHLTTPTLLFANPLRQDQMDGTALGKALAGWRIGISISESENVARRGFGFPRLADEKVAPSSPHLRDSMTEFARFLLAAGATLAYGGDLRQGGFTRVLFELLAAYRAMSGEDSPPVQSWLAWPIHLDLTEEQQADWAGLVDFRKIPPPAIPGIDPAAKLPPTTPENRVTWARSPPPSGDQVATPNPGPRPSAKLPLPATKFRQRVDGHTPTNFVANGPLCG